jgi:hypothetical protein|nr:MAG TPA: hypothetical protein [Caudoviricetes sp.]
MIRTTLPVVEKSIDENNNLVVNKKNINVSVDTSLFAEERWEQNFPHNAKNETLFAYIERVKNAGQIESKAHILSNLKALYCFMEGNEIPDFKTFCQMFDLADATYLGTLIDKIKTVFDLVLNGSTATPKN